MPMPDLNREGTQPEPMPLSLSLDRAAVLARFNRNLARHIIGVAQALNERLTQQCADAGHTGIKPACMPILAQIDIEGTRSIDIATRCGITPQAAGQIVNELEQLGYIKRKPDVEDKRAKRLILTTRGRKLCADAAQLSTRIDQQLVDAIGSAALTECKRSSAQLYQRLLGPDAAAESGPYYFGQCLAGLATYCEQALMELDRSAGHLRLKMSFSQVLIHSSPYGSLINDLAKINNVSKQAISQIVKELEELGYVERKQNPEDARSSKIFLTEYGFKLIQDSVANFSALEERFVDILRQRAFDRFAQTMEQLYQHFFAPAARSMDEAQRVRSGASLQHFAEMLYRDKSDEERAVLFSRFGNKIRFSDAALQMLAELTLKPGR